MPDRDDPPERLATVRDPEVAADNLLRDVRRLIAHLRAMPGDGDARAELHARATEHGVADVVALLEDEARAAERPQAAAAFLRELCELHLAQGHANEAEAVYRRLRATPGLLTRLVEVQLLEHLADVYERELDQPFDALSAIERLLPLAPQDPAMLQRVARLSERLGAWEGAAAALERVAEAALDDGRAREALRRAAALLGDHGVPVRAIELYRRVVTHWPGDVESWRDLEALHERESRWRDLAEARRALAGLATDGAGRAGYLRGQARALLRAGSAAAAASIFAEAAEVAPESPEALLDRTDALCAAGHAEAARSLIEAFLTGGGAGATGDDDPSLRARLRLRLAELLTELDAPRARALVEAVLAEAPGHPAALALLVRLTEGEGDAAVADAHLRQALALPDGAAKIDALLEAARRLGRSGEHAESAAEAYATVLAFVPDHPEATRALAAVRAGLDVERALAGLADALDAGRAAEADAAARAALTRFADAPAEARGRLCHQAGRARRALGDLDEAHGLFAEAHRLRRDDLRITIDLGRSCFERHLWREAALHLSALATHPRAAEHAGEVAAALVLAAQAETRALRPALAEGLYRSAVALDPRATAAWHGLGELAMQRGDVAGAADDLEHEAAATSDSRDRVRLYDALGDLAEELLDDPARAVRCWLEAARAAPPDTRQLPLYDKLLALLRAHGPAAARGEIAEHVAVVHPDASPRRAHALEAVHAFVAAGAAERARGAAARLADAEPHDDEAVALAGRLELEAGDHEAASARLGRALNARDAAERGKPAPTGALAVQRAGLWLCLGDARRGRGDWRGAELAWQRALGLAPDGATALGAHRGLVAAAARAGRPALVHLRVLVDAEPQPDDVLALAEELAVACDSGLASRVEARAMFELAGALGRPSDEAEERFGARHPLPGMASDQAYAAPLGDAERRALVDDADDAPLGEVLAMLWEAAPLLVPDARTALDRAGFAEAERVPPTSPAAAPALYPPLARALGGGTTLLYETRAPGTPDLTLLAASPPVVLFGAALVSRRARSSSDADLLADAELRFRLGRIVELARPARVLAAGLPLVELAQLVGGLVRAFGRGAAGTAAGDVAPEVAAQAERLKQTLPLLLRTRLAERLDTLGPEALDPMRFLAACERAADRAGLIVCTHVGVAITAAGGPRAATHLVRLAGSARFLAARRKLRER